MTDDPTPSALTTSGQIETFLPPHPVRWGWPDVLYGVIAFVLSLAVGVAVLLAVGIDANDVDAVGTFTFASALFAYAAIAAVVVAAARRRGLGSLAADFGLRFQPVDIAIGLGIGIAVKFFAMVLTVFAVWATNHTPESGNFELSTSPLWIVLNGFILAAIVAPIVEELFFRGLVLRAAYNRVLRRGGTVSRAVTIGVLASAIGFALLHLYQSPDVTLLIILGGSTLALGVANALVTLTTGRLGAAIVAHVFFNGSSVLLALVFG